jgi:putative membrane protein
MGTGWFIGIVIFIIVIWFLARVVYRNNTSRKDDTKSALDSLNERYARGEISKEEYEEIKSSIS